jgi:hypothetical protein
LPGYLYFVEGRTVESIDRAELDAWGLGYIADRDGVKPTGCRSMKGPGGVSGVTFAMRARQENQNIIYQEESQEWRAMEMAGDAESPDGKGTKLWVGWWKHAPPRPADLERRETLKGAKVKLADGNEWIVPVLREWPVKDGDPPAPEGEDAPQLQCSLPQMLLRTKAGWVLGDVQAKYQTLWDHHCDACANLFTPDADGVVSMDFDQLLDHCVELLAVNYVVGFDELSAAGVIDTRSLRAVIEASCEWAKVMAYHQKKTTESSPDSSDGAAA